jgi:hypothetical protein
MMNKEIEIIQYQSPTILICDIEKDFCLDPLDPPSTPYDYCTEHPFDTVCDGII